MSISRLLLTGLLLLLTASFAMGEEDASADKRVREFTAKYADDRIEAIKVLKPLNHPKLVTALISVYLDEDPNGQVPYDPLYDAADEALLTAEGDAVVAKLVEYLEPRNIERVRVRLVGGLCQKSFPAALASVVRLAPNDKSEAFQLGAANGLRYFTQDDAVATAYKLALKGLSPAVNLAAVASLAKMNNDKTEETLWKLYDVKSGASGQVRSEALNALYARKAPGATDVLVAALDDKEPAVRIIACAIAAAADRKDLGPKIIANLQSPVWQLRSVAAKACGKLKLADSVGPLIALWKTEKGRVEEDIHRSLMEITGKSFPPIQQAWENWFNSIEGQVDVAEKPGEYVSYHGLKTKSKNLAFVIDRSGSMAEKVKSKSDGYVGEGAVVKDDTKLAFVKAELIRVIKMLPKDTKFNIVAFDDRILSWKKEQTEAAQKIKDEAVKWVEALTPGGATNVYDALAEAFGRLTPGGKVNTEYKGGPDTIFLLTDGMPNFGTIPNAPDILKAIEQINRIRQVTIHTLGVGQMCEMFLKPLAEQNNGTYRLIAE